MEKVYVIDSIEDGIELVAASEGAAIKAVLKDYIKLIAQDNYEFRRDDIVYDLRSLVENLCIEDFAYIYSVPYIDE